MARRHYQLPSLTMLGSFEAAARNGSFKEAAEELNVTAGAVSHQVKALERELETELFIRKHRSVELTSDGWTLYEGASRGFIEISKAVKTIRNAHESGHISIGATTAVSSLWLTPRLTRFWREFGDIKISQEVRDRPFPRPINLDFVIEYAIERPKDANELLFGDELLPLASPKLKKNYKTLEDLARAPLIHLDAKETNWTSWPNWFSSMGYEGSIAEPHRVNNYSIALQLAKDGTGIVLGWRHLVEPLLQSGELVPVSDFQNKAPGAFYLIQTGNLKAGANQLKDWLIASS